MITERDMILENRRAIIAGLPARLPVVNDFVFKTTMTDPESGMSLCDLVESTLNIGIKSVTIVSNEPYLRSDDDKRLRLDLLCTTNDDNYVNVEMQASHMDGDSQGTRFVELFSRLEYYIGSIFSRQSAVGSAYQEIPASFLILFVNYTVFPSDDNYISHLSFRNETGNRSLAGKQNVIIIELTKIRALLSKSVEDMTDIEMWSLFIKYSDLPEYRHIIANIANRKEAIKMADAVLSKISQEEKQRWAYYLYERAIQDEAARRRAAEISGEREGMQKGIQEGAEKERRDMAISMILDGEPDAKIMRYTKIEQSSIDTLRVEINNRHD